MQDVQERGQVFLVGKQRVAVRALTDPRHEGAGLAVVERHTGCGLLDVHLELLLDGRARHDAGIRRRRVGVREAIDAGVEGEADVVDGPCEVAFARGLIDVVVG